MRSFALAAVLVSASLVACVSTGADDGDSNEQDIHIGSADAGPATDASVPTSDGGSPVTDASVPTSDGGSPVTDASVPDVPTYVEVAPLIRAACAGCHHTSFDSLAKVKANKSRMLQMIGSGRMPRNNPGWKNTADGQDVLDFLQHSPELQ